MKTLDEVIKALDNDCKKCGECPYVEEKHCRIEIGHDALHYLIAFRDAKDTLEREKDRYAEAVKNCERAENIYKQKQKAAEDALWIYKDDKDDLTALRAYRKEQYENNALTWDELRQMEGKPVWVEYGIGFNQKRWVVIHSFHNTGSFCYMDVSGNYPNSFWEKDMGADEFWQAYRKERE